MTELDACTITLVGVPLSLIANALLTVWVVRARRQRDFERHRLR